MSRKRRLAKAKHTTEPPSPVVAGILLSGWNAAPLDGRPHHGFSGSLGLFTGGEEEFTRLWKKHETWLRAEASRLGIMPEWRAADGRAVFFAESLQE